MFTKRVSEELELNNIKNFIIGHVMRIPINVRYNRDTRRLSKKIMKRAGIYFVK